MSYNRVSNLTPFRCGGLSQTIISGEERPDLFFKKAPVYKKGVPPQNIKRLNELAQPAQNKRRPKFVKPEMKYSIPTATAALEGEKFEYLNRLASPKLVNQKFKRPEPPKSIAPVAANSVVLIRSTREYVEMRSKPKSVTKKFVRPDSRFSQPVASISMPVLKNQAYFDRASKPLHVTEKIKSGDPGALNPVWRSK